MVKGFYSLKIQEQVDIINTKLEKNISLKKVCRDLGINKVKLNDKFNKLGYLYDDNLKVYGKVIKNDNKSISNIKHKEIEVVEPVSKENNLINIDEFKSTLEEMKEILVLKDSLKEVIENYNKNKNVIDVPESPELKIDADKFTKDLNNRLIRVYSNINEDWMKFCKKNKQYKMQDLYSQALLEFMNKYKK